MDFITSLLNFEKICRTCKLEAENMYSIFDTSKTTNLTKYSEMIMECASVSISKNDGLPESICIKCADNLRHAYDFKNQCEQTDQFFRKVLEEQNSIKIENDYENLDLIEQEGDHSNLCENNQIAKEEIKNGNYLSNDQSNDLSENRKKIFSCKICRKTFQRLNHLKNHMIIHLKTKPHQCRVCTRGFNKLINLVAHEKNCKGERALICEICDRSFARIDSLKVHMEGHEDRQPIIDSINDFDDYIEISVQTKFEKQLNGNKNCQNKTKNKISKSTPKDSKKIGCDKCKKAFHNETYLKIHYQKHTNAKHTFECWECDKVFKRPDHLKQHIDYVHLDHRPFVCEVCSTGFKRKVHLERHVQCLHGPKVKFQCEMCAVEFSKQYLLKKHISVRHEVGEKLPPLERKLKCHLCEMTFAKEKYRQLHIKRGHMTVKICKVCQVKFHSKDELKKHLKTSKDCEKRFLCSECGKGFPDRYNLDTHLRRHRGEKPFKCSYCEKCFAGSADLRDHEKHHTGDKIHLCNDCGKGFTRPNKLIVHMRKHTGEKPYQCTQCNFAFAQKSDLLKHIKRHIIGAATCDKKLERKPKKIQANKKILKSQNLMNVDPFLIAVELQM